MSIKVSKILAFSIILITLLSVQTWSDIVLTPNLTSLLVLVFLLCYVLIWSAFRYSTKKIILSKGWELNSFYLIILVTIIRSIFIANTDKAYWISFLTYAPGMLSLVLVYYVDRLYVFRNIMKYWIKFIPFLCLLWLPFTEIQAIGFMLPLLLIFLLLLKALPTRYKWYVLLMVFFIIVVSYFTYARSHVIKYGIAFLLGGSIFFKKSISNYYGILKKIRYFFLLAPFIFFFIGALGNFNIFKISDYITDESDLTVDTRTFIYEEAILSSTVNNYELLGRSFARGYDSFFQAKRLRSMGEESGGKYTDRISEVGIVNLYTWMGIIGVIVYFFIMVKATKLAVIYSNNIYTKIVGVFVAFQWAYSWIENFQRLDIATITLWILLGICYSKVMRSMSDVEFEVYVRSIFKKRSAFKANVNSFYAEN